jgi:DNA-binding FrmR family transcriptional regulator
MIHESHKSVVNRLKRAEGHLRTIIRMVEQGKPCVDVAQQLHAVEKALSQAKKTFIRDHIDHCLDGAVESRQDARALVSEFKEMSKYL